MRILRVAQKTYPEVKGGAAYHIHAMSRDQAALGHDVTVLTVRHDSTLSNIEHRDGYTIIRYDPAISLLGNEICPGVAQYLSQAKKFDVIHAHSHLYFSTNIAAVKRFFDEIPLAITNHGLYSQTAPKWVFDLYLRTLGRWTFNQADVVFCYTETDKKRVRELGVSSSIKVIHNGIDTERFTPDGSTTPRIDSDGPVLLFVGRFVQGKQPEIAIRALSKVHNTYPDAELYLCGEGTLREELENEAKQLDVRNQVTFLGHVPYDEMPQIYGAGDVLVLPSRAEGLPRTVLEAKVSGLPVVGNDLEQIANVLGSRDRLVTVKDGAKIGEAIVDVLAFDGGCRAAITEKHRWTDTVARTTDRLKQLVNSDSFASE